MRSFRPSAYSFSGHHACSGSTAGRGKIQVDSVLARKNGNRMDVAFRMNLNDLKMKSEQQIVFTPVMVGTDSIALNPIIIQGRNQAVRYRRLADSKKNPQAQVLTRKNKTSQQVYFAQSVPYQKWMKKFKLSVKEDLCGCGNLIEQDNTPIADIDRTPKITKDFFVQPKAEAKKVRAERVRPISASSSTRVIFLPTSVRMLLS